MAESDPKELELIAKVMAILAKKLKAKKTKSSKLKIDEGILNRALKAKRLLPGAKMVRSGRPMVDLLKKIKKAQRRQIKGSMIQYRKSVKGAQKAMISQNRSTAKKAYKTKK